MHEEESEGNHVQASKSPFPGESHRTCLFPPAENVTTHMKCCEPSKLIRDPVLRVVIEG